LIIGIVGGIGTGKSSVVDRLREQHEYSEVSIAASLKAQCAIMFPTVPREAFFGTQVEKATLRQDLGGVSGRTVLEETAAHFRRYDPDVWVRRSVGAAISDSQHAEQSIKIAVPDVRYPNEVALIKKMGGVIVRTHVLGENPPRTGHDSDNFWPHFEYDFGIVAGRGDMIMLRAQVDEMAEQLGAR